MCISVRVRLRAQFCVCSSVYVIVFLFKFVILCLIMFESLCVSGLHVMVYLFEIVRFLNYYVFAYFCFFILHYFHMYIYFSVFPIIMFFSLIFICYCIFYVFRVRFFLCVIPLVIVYVSSCVILFISALLYVDVYFNASVIYLCHCVRCAVLPL